jgi:hypothetical protein
MSASILNYYHPVPGDYLVGTCDHSRKVTWISPATRAVIATGKGLAHLGRTATSSANRMPDNHLHLPSFSLGTGQFAMRNQWQWSSFATITWSTGVERMCTK